MTNEAANGFEKGWAARHVPVVRYFIGGGVVIAALLAIFEPSSAIGLGFVTRAVYYQLLVLPLLLLMILAARAAFERSWARSVSPWLVLTAVGIAVAVIASPYTFALEWLFDVHAFDDAGETPPSLAISLLSEMWEVPVPATASWLALNLLVSWRGTAAPPVPPPPAIPSLPPLTMPPAVNDVLPETPAQTQFRQRLQIVSLAEVSALEAQQHYLRVYLQSTDRFILCGLGAAVDDLRRAGIEGTLVHRSYWVNWAFVEGFAQDNGRLICRLTNGLSIPVSRRRWAEIRAEAAQRNFRLPEAAD